MDFWGFWFVAVSATFAVFSILLRKLFSPLATDETDRELAVYIDQLGEVDRDLNRGIIGSDDAERLRVEVSRRLLKADTARKNPIGPSTHNLPAASAVIALVLGAGIFLYQWLGAPGYSDLPLSKRLALAKETHDNRPSQAAAEAQAPKAAAVQMDAEFADLMTKLRAALIENPDDQVGLALLGRNEASIGNFVQAKDAYLHLISLQGGNAPVEQHLSLAQTMIAAAGGYISPQAEEQLIEVLRRDPTNGLARYFSGLLAAQTGRPDLGFELWEPLLREGPADAPWMEPIRLGLPDLAERAGIKYQPTADPKGPTTQDIKNASEMSSEDQKSMIAGMVGQLEQRLFASGGSVAEWSKLITSLGVLGETARAKAAFDAASQVFSGDSAAAQTLDAAATQAGLVP